LDLVAGEVRRDEEIEIEIVIEIEVAIVGMFGSEQEAREV